MKILKKIDDKTKWRSDNISIAQQSDLIFLSENIGCFKP